MRIEIGDIWNRPNEDFVVIPTNVGWDMNGRNVMGAGLAKQASERFPGLAQWYGAFCRNFHADAPDLAWHAGFGVVMLPVKPLNRERPWLSWKQPASIELVERSLIKLSQQAQPMFTVSLPLVGCGNGRLMPALVLPIMDSLLDRRFTLVVQKSSDLPEGWR